MSKQIFKDLLERLYKFFFTGFPDIENYKLRIVDEVTKEEYELTDTEIWQSDKEIVIGIRKI